MPTPIRYKFDKARATTVLTLIEEAEATGDWDRVNKTLAPALMSHVDCLYLGSFEPTEDLEVIAGQVSNLLSLAWQAEWFTGPAEPTITHEDRDEYAQFCIDLGKYPASGRLVTEWRDLSEWVGGYAHCDAAVELLENLTSALNEVLTELDNYIAARTIEKRPGRGSRSRPAGWWRRQVPR